MKDVIYQMDTIYLRKMAYQGKPVYPIEQRDPTILVNIRTESPKWESADPVKSFFNVIHKVGSVLGMS